MDSLLLAVGVSAAGAGVALVGVVASMWTSRRRITRSRPGADPGLVVAVVGGIAVIGGLGDLAFLLLTSG